MKNKVEQLENKVAQLKEDLVKRNRDNIKLIEKIESLQKELDSKNFENTALSNAVKDGVIKIAEMRKQLEEAQGTNKPETPPITPTDMNKSSRTRTLKVPIVHSTYNDDLATTPVFTSETLDTETIDASVVFSIHKKVKSVSIESDRDFVYQLMRYVYGRDILKTHTLAGSFVTDPTTKNKYKERKLDSKKYAYVLKQYQIRSQAIGINPEDRAARSAEGYFRKYVSALTKSEHTMAYDEKCDSK